MKLLLDMNLSPHWSEVLMDAGYESVHWSAIGPPNTSDVEIMQYDRSLGYVVMTHDLDFSAILAASGGEKPSVVLIR